MDMTRNNVPRVEVITGVERRYIIPPMPPIHHPAHAAHASGGTRGMSIEKYGLVFTGI
jgi:hypothetical protein